jgi:ALG3 protein
MTGAVDARAGAVGRLLWLAATLAFCLKLLLAAWTAGSNDTRTWEHDWIVLRTAGFAELYRSGVQYASPAGRLSQRQVFVHPPAILHGLRMLGALQETSGWPLRFWLRAMCALADLGTLLLLRSMFRDREGALLLFAVAPVSILISGFHGNTDPLMMFSLVAAVFLAQRGNVAGSALAFGAACSVKLVPLLFTPAILLHWPGLSTRVRWAATSLTLWVALGLPYIAQEPSLILRSMFGYGGSSGLWGISLLSTLAGADRYYLPAAKWIAVLTAAALPLFWKRRLFEQAGLIAFSFILLSPGFGLQYLAWTIPWTVILPRRWIILYMAVSGGFALAVYAAAAVRTDRGLYADLLNPVHFPVLILMGILCWILIGAITLRWVRYPTDKEKLGEA